MRCPFLLKVLIVPALLCTPGVALRAQSDTLNRKDAKHLEQGYWKVTGSMKQYSYYHYADTAVIEEGRYTDGVREGHWKYYYANGQVREEITYQHGKEMGPYRKYYEDGFLCEEGTKAFGDFIPATHIMYRRDSLGNTIKYRNGSVKGHVTVDKPRRASHHAVVSLKNLAKYAYPCEYRSGLADSAGNYFIGDICPGTYEVNYGGQGFVNATDTLVISFDDTLERNYVVHVDLQDFYRPALTCGVNIGLRSTIEFSGGIKKYRSNGRLDWITDEWTLGSEFEFRFRDPVIGPKFTFSRTYGFFLGGPVFGGSLIYYTDFTSGALYLHPHVGIGLLWFLNAEIGYNIPLSPYHALERRVSNFTFSLMLSFSRAGQET